MKSLSSKHSDVQSNRVIFCCCCLAYDQPLINLLTCKHAEAFQEILSMDIRLLAVCVFCHSLLRKIHIFKHQVRTASLTLTKQARDSATHQLHNLRRTKITTHALSETEQIDLKTELDATNDSDNTDIKMEPDSDIESDLPLSVVRRKETKTRAIDSKHEDTVRVYSYTELEERDRESLEERERESKKPGLELLTLKKNKRPVIPQPHLHADDKYEGKIVVYVLSRAELEEERERESRKESYMKLPFKCESCLKAFDYEHTLRNHIDRQHTMKKGGTQCDICKVILGPASSKEHQRRHYRRFQCVVCGVRSRNIYSLSQHFNQQHAERGPITHEFQCELCDFTTLSNRVYRYHRDKHASQLQCTECGHTFANASSLNVHVLHVHKNPSRVYECESCDKSYRTKSGLHSHRAAVHHRRGAFCSQCHSHFASPAGLAHHLRTHSKHVAPTDSMYQCDVCSKKFRSKRTLQTHIGWDHLKTVKHECSKCSKMSPRTCKSKFRPQVFKSAGTLRKHNSYVHEKKRPARDKMCDYCGRGFTTTAILRCHIRTHTGARPLQCVHCSATFAHSASLYTHTKLKHNSTKQKIQEHLAETR